MIISSNSDNSNEFSLNSKKDKRVVLPFKQLKDVEQKGTLNAFQLSNLTNEQLKKIKEDKRRLGGE